MMVVPSIQNFSIAKYQITLITTSVLNLPPLASSTFRGAFSQNLKKITCRTATPACNKCDARIDCAFYLLCENSGEFSSLQLDRFKNPPKPFIFEPPVNINPQNIEKGEKLHINLVLVGRAIQHFPLFIRVFKEMGMTGIGNGRGKFYIKEIWSENPVKNFRIQSYSNENGQSVNASSSFTLQEFLRMNMAPAKFIKKIQIDFLTPTRFKSSNTHISPLNFGTFLQTLLTRISNMAYSYCNQRQPLNFRDLVKLAKTIEILTEKHEWQDIRRFQMPENDIEIFQGGYIGRVIYQGDLTPFWPWLKVGETLHIGKNCAFGLGRYSIVEIRN
ncbi:CRISPR system precrRNA processing endoribonuclease RAMP protein Cas6 [candidate division KSB1 bacterium]|nr:CRISPR system precrRNA processing endoribonuclease RAMP protein Cas6 [candidate division KSB1 bacterium]